MNVFENTKHAIENAKDLMQDITRMSGCAFVNLECVSEGLEG